MYRFFFFMLALNMSKEVLSALVDGIEKFEAANTSTVATNEIC
jgi:hypothetical protein